MKLFCTMFVLGLALAGVAHANDTMAELRTGGLKFARTSAVQMASEDLFLSMDEVRVHYVFHNRTNKDVTALVAFPMPRLGPQFYFEPVSIPDAASANFMRFKTLVNGHAIAADVTQKALLGGADVTARVRAAGLPLSQLDPRFADAVKALAPATRAALENAKLIENVSGDPKSPEYRALWMLDTAFASTIRFPAGTDVIVDHRYAPIVGGAVESILVIDSIPRSAPDRRKTVRDYCVDAPFETAARATRDRVGVENLQERRLGYVLKTGANWAGPIGKFHLTVDKGAPGNLASVCLPDIAKTGPTTFELTRRNFTPMKDIEILFLVPHRPQ